MMGRKAYPWPVSRKPWKNSAVGDAARNSGGIDAWGYPEDAPSHSGRQHTKGDEYGQFTYRPSWAVLCLTALVWAAIIALIVLWAGAASAEEGRFGFGGTPAAHDSAGRYILHGDPGARPSPHHSGGGVTTGARRYFFRIRDRGPFRVDGEWFSSGAMVLALVSGPDSVSGSCLGDVEISFHEGIPLSGDNSNLSHNRFYSGVFTRPLRDWYHTMRNGGGMSYLHEMTLDQQDLGRMGYPMCEEEQ